MSGIAFSVPESTISLAYSDLASGLRELAASLKHGRPITSPVHDRHSTSVPSVEPVVDVDLRTLPVMGAYLAATAGIAATAIGVFHAAYRVFTPARPSLSSALVTITQLH